MKKLKTILQHKYLYIFIIIVSIFIVLFFTKIKQYDSNYKQSDSIFIGTIKKINYNENYVSLRINAKEMLTAFYYFDNKNEKEKMKSISLGDKIYVKGELVEPDSNRNPNVFNYKKYLYNNRQFYTLNIKEYKIIEKNKNVFYKIKNYIITNLSDNKKADQYIKAFVLGDNDAIDDNLINAYRKIGISHLFSVSGMHISLIMFIIIKILDRFKFNKIIVFGLSSLFLFFYMFLVDFSPSVLRSGILFLICRLNTVFKLELSAIKCFIISIFVNLLINPFICYKIGFIYSAVISFYLILFSKLISKGKNYFSKLFITSFVGWLVSIPITIYNFFEINLFSVVYNLIFVPLISMFVFPLSLLAFIFSFFKPILVIFINLLEKLTLFFSNIDSVLIFIKPNLYIIIVYFIIITILLYELKYKRIKFVFLFVFIFILHYNWNFVYRTIYLITLDVGQSDCLMLHNKNKTILLDIGKESRTRSNKTLNDVITVLKSYGIRKIEYLILTHGDYDHMGEAINLVENFKVEKVIFNCGEFNELEQELIKVLDKKKIPYYSCIKELNIDGNKLYFLNNKDYGNENDNSSVIYTELNNHKFLFMGDAGVEVEEDLIQKYNLQNIDVLKVGHHGSKTSSSKNFIDEINPKYSIISVGKNNRYGHPNDSVLDNLKDSKIYRTDQDGSIIFKIKNNKLKTETCAP